MYVPIDIIGGVLEIHVEFCPPKSIPWQGKDTLAYQCHKLPDAVQEKFKFRVEIFTIL